MYDGIRTLEDMDFSGKKVFLRVDYNIPLDKQGNILDDYRIKASLPTIKALFQRGASQLIIASHLGRPQNKEKEFRMGKIAERLLALTGRKVEKMDDCVDLDDLMPSPQEASIVLLENLRFHEEEEKDDEGFAKKLAKSAQLYVNDAFAVSHRKHASVHSITKFLPGCMGLLLEKEVKAFSSMLSNPDRPFIAIIGGSKLETKLPMINNLLPKADKVLVGGGMMFTFYKAKGYGIGKSICDDGFVDTAKTMLSNPKIVLPKDVVVSDDRDAPSTIMTLPAEKIPRHLAGLDIGDGGVLQFKNELSDARLVVWNGPLGYYENPAFSKATMELMNFLANNPQIKTVIGGGDTVAIAEELGLREKFTHVSTGGGASLEMLEGKSLPGIEALRGK